MNDRIDAVLARHGGAASRAELIQVISRHALDNEIKRGRLVAVFPRVYARPWQEDDPLTQLHAALLTVGGEVALSHVTGLARWNLPVPADTPLHVTAYNPRHPRGVPGRLTVHRTLLPLNAVFSDGLPTVSPELAVVTSWPLLAEPDRRAPVITAARRRLLHPGRVLDLAERMWWLRGRIALQELLGLLAAGCQSELELWGYTDVFNVPGLDDAVRQKVVHVDGRTYWLDMAYEEERLAVELDGRKYHESTEQWERDIARDLALAKIGWQTIRYPHDRLHADINGCRRDTLAVRAARRAQLGHRLAS